MVSDANNPVGDNYENLKKLKFTKFFDFSYWLGLVVFIFVKAVPTGCARVPTLVRMHHMKTQFSWASPTGTHVEYADEQLANLQKRIWLIEFLRLGLIIGCQGTILGLPRLIKPHFCGFLLDFQYFYEFEIRWLKTMSVSQIYELFKLLYSSVLY